MCQWSCADTYACTRLWCSTCWHVSMNMYSTDRSSPAPSHFSPAFLLFSRRFGGMASTPVSSIASSATNVADVLASLGDEALAAEVGSWSAELQAKVVAAASALTSTPTSTTASTSVRRRKSNKADTASSSAAASWLTPAVEPADLSSSARADHGRRRGRHLRGQPAARRLRPRRHHPGHCGIPRRWRWRWRPQRR